MGLYGKLFNNGLFRIYRIFILFLFYVICFMKYRRIRKYKFKVLVRINNFFFKNSNIFWFSFFSYLY